MEGKQSEDKTMQYLNQSLCHVHLTDKDSAIQVDGATCTKLSPGKEQWSF